ncbi:radical SAM/SPASM domain-containing protein [Ruminococcus flavefaciens]|uniref:radical SAM/SPASM domain-containing protein n=1 Tax=Ruminococcus flavefaciens TaxID=1265 RepID=UPI00048BED58|nr:radical SAM protein [Ruminococcus flavefaciens]
MLSIDMKRKHLEQMREYRKQLMKEPKLRNLFLELTLRCNERCLHCGSYCGDVTSEELSVDQYRTFLSQVKEDMTTAGKMLCITGGEPLLRKEFFDIMGAAHELGFSWGMTSNATLIDDSVARDLQRVGMGTISVSIDGLEDTHDAFRRTPGGYKKAMSGIESLLRVGGFENVQITTVVTHQNIGQLDELYKIFNEMDIDSWRVINIEPMGRAKQHPELILTKEDYQTIFEFIRNKRIAGEPVTYGCSHYLGMEYEREVRDWYYLCTAGLYTASITANGDIIACLDIERRPEFVQGNILKDRFSEVWKNKFQVFRRDLADENETCSKCFHKDYCHGDAFHSWDFDNNKPLVCFKDILF